MAREGSPVIGTAEVFENQRVKVWDFVLEPGLFEEGLGDANALGIADPYDAGLHESPL